jgi:hypothetical protein
MKPELELAAEIAAEYLASFDTHNVSDELGPEVLRGRLSKDLTEDGLPPLQVIRELNEDAREGLLNSAGGRFFGWVIGGSTPVSIAAEPARPRLPSSRKLPLAGSRKSLDYRKAHLTPLSPAARWRMSRRWPRPAIKYWPTKAGWSRNKA